MESEDDVNQLVNYFVAMGDVMSEAGKVSAVPESQETLGAEGAEAQGQVGGITRCTGPGRWHRGERHRAR